MWYVGHKQFREKPNGAEARKSSLEYFKKRKKASGSGIQAEDNKGWGQKVNVLGIWKTSYVFWTLSMIGSWCGSKYGSNKI